MMTDDPIAGPIRQVVEAGELAGAVALVWRGGRVVQCAVEGWSDVAARTPLARDSIFRIASMSKPVTCLAALMLMEDRRFALEDPICRVAPEFTRMRVLRAPEGPLEDTDPAARLITFEDLLTHRAGLTYGDFHTGPINAAHLAALGGSIDSHVAPDAWIAGLGGLPLIDHPGAAFHYGHSTDLLGLLLARMEGVSLGEVLRERIFEPLGMKDTGFRVPPEKHARRAGQYGFDDAGALKRLAKTPGGATVEERPADMTFEAGGQGLWSTADDYLTFARLFAGDGEVDGVRLLRPETMALMRRNHLTDAQRAGALTFGMPVFSSGQGFGFGVATVLDPATAQVMRGKGGVGTVSWPGAFGGWWQADPTEGSAMVFLTHNMMEVEQLMAGVGLGVYGAIMQVHALGTAA